MLFNSKYSKATGNGTNSVARLGMSGLSVTDPVVASPSDFRARPMEVVNVTSDSNWFWMYVFPHRHGSGVASSRW